MGRGAKTRQLASEGPLDDGVLEASNGGIELLGTQRTLPNELVENLRRDGRQGRVGLAFRLAAHSRCHLAPTSGTHVAPTGAISHRPASERSDQPFALDAVVAATSRETLEFLGAAVRPGHERPVDTVAAADAESNGKL